MFESDVRQGIRSDATRIILTQPQDHPAGAVGSSGPEVVQVTSEGEEGEGEDRCPDTGLYTHACRCASCRPITIQPLEILLDSPTLHALIEKTKAMLEMLRYLEENHFILQSASAETGFVMTPPEVDQYVWTRCSGCGYPIITERGGEIEGLCTECTPIADSLRPESAEYYGDLFDYVSMMCSLGSDEGLVGAGCRGDLSFVKHFCRMHDIDFEAVKRRLYATGGHCDCEVLLNSSDNIPRFSRLPKLEEN
ncbi:MAG: DUF2695 domain-containing protein [Candidatus Thorarchaeota archaeon]|nr:DUF2695 domain-containing protein [Candidatus Thorarchaeota archaeon]